MKIQGDVLDTINAAIENVKMLNQLEEIKERLEKKLTIMINSKDSTADSEALLSKEDMKRMISFTIENLPCCEFGREERVHIFFLLDESGNESLYTRPFFL